MNLYVGYTYYFDGERFRNQALTCISESFDDVIFYLQNIRGLIIVNTHNPDNEMLNEVLTQANLTNSIIPVAEVVKYGFESEMAIQQFLASGTRERFFMVEHKGPVDHRLASAMKKKDNNRPIYIPDIVEDIIFKEIDDLNAQLSVVGQALKRLFVFVSPRKDLKELKKSIMTTIDQMDEIREGHNDITAEIMSRHPILFCSEEEYRTEIKRQLNWESLKAEWKRVTEDDGS